jgi:hypothetical protein
MLRNPTYLPLSPKYSISGSSNYVDTTGHVGTDISHLVNDGKGALSGGRAGNNFADSFLGSYSESWTAVYRGPHTATVYFTATNETNLNSLAHPAETFKYGPYMTPILGPVGFIMPFFKSVSMPWDAGPVSQTTQTFQWAATVPY